MTPQPGDAGIAVVCDLDGTVRQIVRDDLGLSSRVTPGTHISDLVDPAERGQLALFLAQLGTGAAQDWAIATPVDGALLPLHYGGSLLTPGYLVVAARAGDGLARLSEELMRINNEQANVIRSTAKELSAATSTLVERDMGAFEELTRLNNEMSNLHRELARKNAELEAMNAQKNRFLGMAAHDLRTPLGGIRSYAGFLESEAADVLNEEQREFVTTIRETSEFMLRMVSDILDVTAIEAGQLKLERQSTDLVELIRRDLRLNHPAALKKGITLRFEAPATHPRVHVDAGKIEQVLNNLLGNAIKFSHAGTTVHIRLSTGTDGVTIAVQDQGQGIPAADLTKLFKPFSKASVRSTAGESSTGLGLAIVRRIVEGHGGVIKVDSVVGQGSTFSLTLPLDVG